MTHHLIDLETLATTPGAIILSIGVVRFDLERGICDTLYVKIDPRVCEADGLACDMETLLWWTKQSAEAREEAFSGKATLLSACLSVSKWLAAGGESVIWGNSPSFDCDILAAAFAAVKRPLPWTHRQERCLRTALDFYRIVGVDVDAARNDADRLTTEKLGGPRVKHHALHDAIYEAHLLLACERRRVGGRTPSCDTADGSGRRTTN